VTKSEISAEIHLVTDYRLSIDSSQSLNSELIESVNALCARVENADGDDVLPVLHIVPSEPTTSWPGEVGVHLVNQWERALRRLERLNALTVTVLEGVCRGPALDVLLATDYRIATEETLVGVPSHGGEVWPSMTVHRLAQQLGVANSRGLVLFGGDVSAVRAQAIGLVNEVTVNVVGAVAAIAQAAPGAGSELAMRRRLLLDAATVSADEALGAHLSACERTLRRATAGAGAALSTAS